jgi:hypothetical protein
MRLVATAVLLVIALVPTPGRAAPPLSPQQAAWLQRAERREQHGWIFLHIEGEPRERGFQHGYLLAREIAESLRVRRELWVRKYGMDWPWLLKRTKAVFVPRVDRENLAEMDGIVEGLGAAGVRSSREEIVALNAWIELTGWWWPKVRKKLKEGGAPPPRDSCSAFIATGSMTRDGGIVLGHNTMGVYTEADTFVVLDIVPRRGHRILMQAGPGLIHSSTDFFITDAGLVGAETTIDGIEGFDERGIPEFARMRRATQDASSIDEWCAIMKRGNNGGYPNAWLLGDVRTGEIARLEVGGKHVALSKTRDGYFVGSNVPEDLKILRLETDLRDDDIRSSGVARRVRWKALMAQHRGAIDVELGKRLEADHYDAWLRKDAPGARGLCAHGEVDPIPFDPAGLPPYLPLGTFDGKVVDSAMARRMAFAGRWGAACGRPFDARTFLRAHPQFERMEGLLPSRPTQPWTELSARPRPAAAPPPRP